MITVTSVEAQDNLSQLLDTAQREPVIITRHARPAAYMISPQDMKEFLETRACGGQGNSANDCATASARAWNEFETRFGSFAGRARLSELAVHRAKGELQRGIF